MAEGFTMESSIANCIFQYLGHFSSLVFMSALFKAQLSYFNVF